MAFMPNLGSPRSRSRKDGWRFITRIFKEKAGRFTGSRNQCSPEYALIDERPETARNGVAERWKPWSC
jgi:hypothetical protein